MDSIIEAGTTEKINIGIGNQFLLHSSKTLHHSFLSRIVSTKILAEKSKIRARRTKHRSFRQQPSLYRMVLNKILAKKLGINPKNGSKAKHRSRRRSTLYTTLSEKVRKSNLGANSERCWNGRLFRTKTAANHQELSKTRQNSSFNLFKTSFTRKNVENEVDLREQNSNSKNSATTHWRKKILSANLCSFVTSELATTREISPDDTG